MRSDFVMTWRIMDDTANETEEMVATEQVIADNKWREKVPRMHKKFAEFQLWRLKGQ